MNNLPATPNDFVNTFAIFHLWNTLKEFKVGSFEAESYIGTFYKDAKNWSSKTSQLEFNEFARKKIAEHVGFTRRQAEAWSVFDKLLTGENIIVSASKKFLTL